MPRLLRLTARKAADSPHGCTSPSEWRVASPSGGSTLTTSPPRSASSIAQYGPAITCEASMTWRRPSAAAPATSGASEHRRALGEERRDTLREVVALDRELLQPGELAQPGVVPGLLRGPDRHPGALHRNGCVHGDALRVLQHVRLELVPGDDPVDEPD